MFLLRGIFLVLMIAATSSAGAEEKIEDALKVVRRYVPSATIVAVSDNSIQFVAGEFTSGSRFANLLSGDKLYLFSDRTYIYVTWADIQATTIYDKGTWDFDGQIIRLQTDKSVPQKYIRLDQVLMPINVPINGRNQLFLLGLHNDLTVLSRAKLIGNNGEQFFIVSRTQVASITDTEATKARLMKEAWRPKFFAK